MAHVLLIAGLILIVLGIVLGCLQWKQGKLFSLVGINLKEWRFTDPTAM